MKRRLFITSLLAGSMGLASISGIAFADKGGFGGKLFSGNPAEFMQKRLDRLASKLELNADQKQQMQVVMKNAFDTSKPLREQMKAIRDSIKNLDPAAATYDEDLAKLAYEKSEVSRQMTLARGQKRKSVAAILTPEQQAKMKEMRAKRKGHKRHWKHH